MEFLGKRQSRINRGHFPTSSKHQHSPSIPHTALLTLSQQHPIIPSRSHILFRIQGKMNDLDSRNLEERPEHSVRDGESSSDDDSHISCHRSRVRSFAKSPQHLSMSRALLWRKGKILNVLFLSTWKNYSLKGNMLGTGKGEVTNEFTDAVKQSSILWHPRCTIRFAFNQIAIGDIRVGFGQGKVGCETRNLSRLPQMVPTRIKTCKNKTS